jgi:hypothetical protein
MQIFDEMITNLQSLSQEVKTLPAALDAISACKEAGVKVPASGTFRNLDALDMELNRVFGTLDLNQMSDKRKWEAKYELKKAILAAGMVNEPEKLPDQGAVQFFANIMRKHKIPYDGKHMLSIPELDRLMAAASVPTSDRLTIKIAAERAQVLNTERTVLAKTRTVDAQMIRSIFANELMMDAVAKISLANLNRVLAERDIGTRRRMEIKSILEAAEILTQ